MKAREDADVLIVNTAMNLAEDHSLVVIVGEDIDLLVIMVGRCRGIYDNVYFLKPGKGKTSSSMFSPNCQLEEIIADNILFLHAIGGCDTTSALFKVGKMKCLQVLKKNPELNKIIEIYKDPLADIEEISRAGHRFLASL